MAQITTIWLNTATLKHALFQAQAKLCMEHCKEVRPMLIRISYARRNST